MMLAGVELTLFLCLLFIVALLYASVGHGGASGYLALLALFGAAPAVMKPSALMLNVAVSLIAFVQYYRSGHFRLPLFLAFTITSVPASFMGALITPDAALYKQILGWLLLFPVVRLLGLFDRPGDGVTKPFNRPLAGAMGGGVGFFSGMIGIGGGIILSPLLLLLRWADVKETAALSSLFIFVNSLAALAGMGLGGTLQTDAHMALWVVVAVAGGAAGAWMGSRKWNHTILKRVLATVLLVAAVKLITL